MKTLIAFLFLVLALAKPVLASDSVSSTLPDDLGKLEGMYWHNFKNGFVGGHENEEYTATDVLELVSYDKDSMYFRASLSFFNGHSCGISGIAERNGDRLTYYDTTYGNGCVLHVVPTSSSITLDDPTGQCKYKSCGARGSYGFEKFTPTHKKQITYMEKLKNSPQYQAAVEDYGRIQIAKKQGIEPQWANAKSMIGTYAFWGNIEGVKQALIQGADLQFTGSQGWGPVSGAAYNHNIEITQMLLDHGVSINTIEKGGTFLTHAVANTAWGQLEKDQKFKYIKWLLDKGADANIANSDGYTPLSLAVKAEADPRIIDLLTKHTDLRAKPSSINTGGRGWDRTNDQGIMSALL